MMPMSNSRIPAVAIIVCCVSFAAVRTQAGDWSWWRGPNHNGVAAAGQKPPVEWSAAKNVLWKTTVPGRGHSSPTVHGNRIYLATADEQRQEQGLVAFDRATGKQVWINKLSNGGFPKTHAKNTHATCTVACDGERLFVTFHHHNKLTLHAVSLDGIPLWQEEVGPYHPQMYEYGYAPSPTLYNDLVIIAADVDQGGYLSAYDRATGRRVWRQDRFENYSFSSPIVANVAGRDQLLLSGCQFVASYDPATGKPLWQVKGTTYATCGTVVWDGDIVFASGGYPDAETLAVKADGSGKVLWRNRQKCYEQSMLAHEGYVYCVTDQGIAFCWRASDGEEMWKERLSGPISSSPVLAGNTIYATNEKGTTYVFKANPQQFESVAVNQLGDEGFATMSIVDSRIYYRTASGSGSGGERKETLYCLGAK
jgi:outer membrane protein assembly factor BamB